MRTLLAVSAAVLALVGSMESAEARARIRMSIGRTTMPKGPVTPAPPIAAPLQTSSVGRVGYRPAVVITPGQAAVAAAATAAPIAAAANAEAAAEPAPKPQRVAATPTPPELRIREVRAMAPPCEAGKRVGGIERGDAGFCLIN